MRRAQAIELGDIFSVLRWEEPWRFLAFSPPQPFSDEEIGGPREPVPSPRLSSSDRARVQACNELC